MSDPHGLYRVGAGFAKGTPEAYLRDWLMPPAVNDLIATGVAPTYALGLYNVPEVRDGHNLEATLLRRALTRTSWSMIGLDGLVRVFNTAMREADLTLHLLDELCDAKHQPFFTTHELLVLLVGDDKLLYNLLLTDYGPELAGLVRVFMFTAIRMSYRQDMRFRGKQRERAIVGSPAVVAAIVRYTRRLAVAGGDVDVLW